MGEVPVQLKSQHPVDGSETQQSNPAQKDAAENTGLEVENPNLEEDRRSIKQQRSWKETEK